MRKLRHYLIMLHLASKNSHVSIPGVRTWYSSGGGLHKQWHSHICLLLGPTEVSGQIPFCFSVNRSGPTECVFQRYFLSTKDKVLSRETRNSNGILQGKAFRRQSSYSNGLRNEPTSGFGDTNSNGIKLSLVMLMISIRCCHLMQFYWVSQYLVFFWKPQFPAAISVFIVEGLL